MAGTLTIDTLKASSGVLATQNGMTGIPKAWVSCNGIATPPSIYSSFNVSSVTRTATGYYTINFTTALPDANYAPLASGDASASVYGNIYRVGASRLTSSFTVACLTSVSSAVGENNYFYAVAFGN